MRPAMLVIPALILLGACTGPDDVTTPDSDGVTTGDDDDVESGSCDEPQAWPIDDEGHQLDRVQEMFDGSTAFYWMPASPRAAVILMHANNQHVGTLGTVEHEEFYNELARRDIGYFAITNTSGEWKTENSVSNADVQHVAAFRDHLIDITSLTATTPIFSAGFSGGAGFQPRMANGALALGWDFRGVSIHNNGPSITAPVPATFTTHENDDPELGLASYEGWEAAGQPAMLFAHRELALDPMRFTKIPNIDERESQSWFDEMLDLGLVDSAGVRLVPIDQAFGALDAFESASQGLGNARATAQVKVLWRLHLWSADSACDEVQFFEDLL